MVKSGDIESSHIVMDFTLGKYEVKRFREYYFYLTDMKNCILIRLIV